MKKVLILSSVFLVIFIVFTGIAFNNLSNSLDIIEKRFEEEIGGFVVIDRDTLQIVDFNMVNNTFILENNQEVHSSMVFE